ncbi:MAG: helix-turn-helix domain-containing protein [Mycobacterium sp.]|nr:helix-turn-helix domain-containing protein [Mycobacterium sp.]
MNSDVLHQEVVHRQVAGVAQALHQRTDQLAVVLARAITREVRLYRTATPVPFEVVADGCAANVAPILSAIAAETEFDSTAATVLGVERARDGVPLASVMEAYRVGFRRLWEAVLAESANQAKVNGEALRVLTTKLLTAQSVFTEAMAGGYRQEQTFRLHSDESHRSMLIDSLLHGQLLEQYGVWEAADCLRLPSRGPFVVIAADVAAPGTEALAGVESKLRSRDVASAWRLLPDLQVGIVHVKTDKQLAAVLAIVPRIATGRVGVSARFEDLRETGQALRYARMMLRDRAKSESPVAVFDGSVLATAAVSAPEVMIKLVTPTMQCFSGLADQEREILFETFRVWLENDGSLPTVGELMFCHPNTVRYRLHRIEQRTGRCLSRPRDLAELCLAFEVQRRLM